MMHLMLSIFKINVFYSKLPNLKEILSICTLLKHSHTRQGNLKLLHTFSKYPSEAGLGISKTLREVLETNTIGSTQHVVNPKSSFEMRVTTVSHEVYRCL